MPTKVWKIGLLLGRGMAKLSPINSTDPTNPEYESFDEFIKGADGLPDIKEDTSPEFEGFSKGDSTFADSNNIDHYVGTASGFFFHYDHDGKSPLFKENPGFDWNFRPEGKDYIKPGDFKSPEEWKNIQPDLPNPLLQ
ncbi:MAG TPA: hypothetical protein PK529_11135 [Verrucomicrobiales bacterium]|nr:hypothetical protein [Verrucomicrobiales bacterium]